MIVTSFIHILKNENLRIDSWTTYANIRKTCRIKRNTQTKMQTNDTTPWNTQRQQTNPWPNLWSKTNNTTQIVLKLIDNCLKLVHDQWITNSNPCKSFAKPTRDPRQTARTTQGPTSLFSTSGAATPCATAWSSS